MVRDSVAFLRAPGLRVLLRRRALLRRLQAQPRVLPAGARGGRARRAPRRSCCATPTAARCPTRCEDVVREVVAHFTDDATVGVHFHDDTGCGVANALAGVRRRRHPGAGLRSTATASAPATATSRTIIPNLVPEDGRRDDPRRPARAAHRRSSHHIAELVNITPNSAAALRRRLGLRPQGRAAHVSAIARRQDAYEHVDPELVGNGTRFVVSGAGRPVDARRSRPRSSASSSTGQQLGEVLDQLKDLEHEGYHFEAADGSLELLMRDGDRLEAGLLRARVASGSSSTSRATATSVTEATVKVARRRRADHRHRRGQRPGQRPRRRPPRRPSARRYPGAGAAST